MGLGGISIWQILIILVLALLLFGGKRVRNLGKDLGHSMKEFMQTMRQDEKNSSISKPDSSESKKDSS